jgi:hypothetical protein
MELPLIGGASHAKRDRTIVPHGGFGDNVLMANLFIAFAS